MTHTEKLRFIVDERDRLEREGLLVGVRTIQSAQGAWIAVDGRRVLNLCSNNYLGFANDPRLRQAAPLAIDRFGVGPAAVRSIAGTTTLHTELEEKLARFKRVEATISFQSGFNSNIATIPALVGKDDVIFSDELNHASIIDGCRLSGAPIVRYEHCNPASLEQKLREHFPGGAPKRALIITDGVFSMDGDIAPLPALVELAEKYDAMIMVDDAHGEGVLGESGRGAVDHFHVHGRVDVEVGTLLQGVWRGRRGGGRQRENHRVAAPARPAVPVLFGRHRARYRGLPGGCGLAGRVDGPCGPSLGKRALVPG